jgi:hypothetical protein
MNQLKLAHYFKFIFLNDKGPFKWYVSNYHLIAYEDFIFHISYFQVDYMLHWQLHFGNGSLVNCLFTNWKWTYIYWILDHEVEVHLIWVLWTRGPSRMQGANFFEVGKGGECFLFGFINFQVVLSGIAKGSWAIGSSHWHVFNPFP